MSKTNKDQILFQKTGIKAIRLFFIPSLKATAICPFTTLIELFISWSIAHSSAGFLMTLKLEKWDPITSHNPFNTQSREFCEVLFSKLEKLYQIVEKVYRCILYPMLRKKGKTRTSWDENYRNMIVGPVECSGSPFFRIWSTKFVAAVLN